MKRNIMIGLFTALVATLVCMASCMSAQAQGTVTFTSIDETTFDSYMSQTSLTGYINTVGLVGFYPSATTGYDAASANNTAVSLIVGANTAQFSVNVVSGQFGSTGETASETVSSLTPIIGLAIGIVSSDQSDDKTAAISDLFINSNYGGSINTLSSSFSGLLCSFQNQSSAFNANFTLTTPLSSESDIYVATITASPVPEPNTWALTVLGAIALVVFRRRLA
jgi:hypothetical protein